MMSTGIDGGVDDIRVIDDNSSRRVIDDNSSRIVRVRMDYE